ncbi:(Fe-S)-binding protein [Methanobacterium sp. ACI-7]|uniref:(Fe-S)-binding protein n=1 Tax=unclassified Methanobacterium TaxID=2627676 RepID=UPI0039C4A3D4
MEELEFELFEDGSLIKKVIIKNIKPCIISEGQISVLMQLDSELNHVLPLMTLKFPPGKVNYIEKKNILTLITHDRLITIYPSGKVSMNKTNSKEESIEVIRDIARHINDVHFENIKSKKVDFNALREKIAKLTPLSIYNCLPQTNCEECGESTCMAFAIKLLSGESKLNECMLLHEMGYLNNVKCLKLMLGSQIMETLGWNG